MTNLATEEGGAAAPNGNGPEPRGPEPSDSTPRGPALAVSAVSVWAEPLRGLTIGLLLTITLAAFEALAVATAMPVVGRELGSVRLYGWAFSSFMLGNLVGIVVAGVLVDRRGVAMPYVLGVVLFAAGLAIGGLAVSVPVLIAGRAVQGIGAGALPVTAYVAVQREYPRSLRPKMFAYFATAWVVPGLVGPAVAGAIAEHLSWRLVFLGLLPLAAVAVALTLRPLRALAHATPGAGAEAGEDGVPGGAAEDGLSDAPGQPADARRIWLAVRVAAGAALLLAALELNGIVAIVVAAAAGLALALPALVALLPAGTLTARRGLPVTVLLRGLLTFGFSGTEAFLPLMLVSLRGTSASIAGLTLTAATITWTLGAWIQARWFERVGGRPLIGIGFATVAVGIVSIVPVLRPEVPYWLAVVSWAVTGLGMGICFAPITMTVMNLARPSEQGAATAAVSVSDVVGTALGTGVAGAIVAAGASSNSPSAASLAVVFGSMAAVVALGALLTGRVRAGAPASRR